MKRAVIVSVVVVLIIGAAVAAWILLRPSGPGADEVARNNHGVGLMGRYDYEPALEVFAGLVEQRPDWLDARVNLAIATLNRQLEGDSEAALGMLEAVLAEEPDHLRARYCAALLRLYLRSPEEALRDFQAVAEGDPTDAYAAYYTGQCHAQVQQYEQAIEWYERAIEIDPYLRSAYYGLNQTLQRVGRADRAQEMLDVFHRLETNPQARIVKFIYGRMGPKAEAIAVDVEQRTPRPLPEGELFAAPIELPRVPIDEGPASITACDIDGDGLVDLFIAAGETSVLLQGAAGTFALADDHPLSGRSDVRAALWGDVDNDGLVDVYLCRRGANELWRQSAPQQWEDVTASTGTAGGDLDTIDGAIFDADHDGDLDLYCVNANGPNELLSNNLDGTFRAIGAESRVAGDGRPSRQVVTADLDGDRDTDLLVIHEQPPHEVWTNELLWSYEPVRGMDELLAAPIRSAVAGDVDADGRTEIYTVGEGGLLRWTVGDDGRWGSAELELPRLATKPSGDVDYYQSTVRAFASTIEQPLPLTLADLDGDGRGELICDFGVAWIAVTLGGRGSSDFKTGVHGGLDASLALILLDPARGPAVVALREDGTPLLWPAGPGRHPFMALTFSGLINTAEDMRSNASGIGARTAVRVDSSWTAVDTFDSSAGRGQSLQPIAVGLAGFDHADYLRVLWPDGLVQTEVHGVPALPDQEQRDFSAGSLVHITEIQRQKSSCPVLFVWDGERYRFVTDVLGVGGMGYLVAPGEYAPPRPWENLLLPEGLLRAADGTYRLRLGEPMEEACYLDAAHLAIYDLPPGWSMTVDERMSIAGPEPSGRAIFYRDIVQPARAINDRGDEVTSEVLAADQRAAPIPARDHRFIGRLAGEHVLDLRFDEPLDGRDGQPVLIADGWVEYPYSQTSFAAWQAGAAYEAPTLEARAPDEEWVTIAAQFGYPAGMPRQMAFPLEGLPPGATELRLRTNQEIYWDAIAVAWSEPCPQARRWVVDADRAVVQRSGFAARTTGPQRLPHYDYADRPPLWDARHQSGLYTAFGDAQELIARGDGALAIIGPGEEIHLEFPDRAGPPEAWTRRFVLELEGWCKDMDLYTRDGRTLEPLPGDPGRRRDRLHERYNTRYESGE